ncbi:MAG: hypothetical protein JW849_04370 [Phycisphaerae bacterium]|nr:hypothetical protein [Phycisphaerae bacterium]
MTKRERILIGCPRYKMYVLGSYECDEAGRYLLRPDGTFDVFRAKCGQRGGLCNEPLCFLHRYNKRGPGTWYPTEILASRTDDNAPRATPSNHPKEGDLF